MRFLLRLFFLLTTVFFLSQNSNGQRYSYVKYPFLRGFSVSPKAGVNWFWGDLVDERPFNYTFGLSSEKELKEYLNARIDIKYGIMSGTQINPSNQLPFATFENSYFTTEAGVAFHPLPLLWGFYKQRKFKPYIVGQLGIIGYDATEKFGAGCEWKHEDGTPIQEGEVWNTTYGYEISTVFTIGGGLNYYINKKLSLSLEWLFSAPMTDMLDAHKEWEASGTVGTDILHRTDGPIDPFYTGTISLNYTFAESQFKNQFKYNRKLYTKARKDMSYKKTKSARAYNRANRKR